MQAAFPSSTAGMKPAREHGDVEDSFSTGVPVYQGSAMVKAGFIRKVYAILTIQLLLTAMGSAFFMFHTPTRQYVLSNPGMLMTASFAPFGFLLALFCYKDKHPVNMFLLGGFTLCMTYTVGVVCAMYYENHMGVIVLQGLILTASVFISLTSYVLVTQKDFSFLGAGLFAGLIMLIMWGFLNSFVDFGGGGRMIFSLIGALIFVGYILYDTSMIIHYMGPDDYIMAAVTLYLDIINLFLYLLEFLRMLQGGDN
jgi:FtsH-binding integral membrane protein